MKVIFIPAGTGTPEIREIDDSLEAKQALVGGLIECVSITDAVDMWVNEEGLLLELPFNVVASGVATRALNTPVHICGDVYLARHDGQGGTVGLSPDDCSLFLSRTRRSSHV